MNLPSDHHHEEQESSVLLEVVLFVSLRNRHCLPLRLMAFPDTGLDYLLHHHCHYLTGIVNSRRHLLLHLRCIRTSIEVIGNTITITVLFVMMSSLHRRRIHLQVCWGKYHDYCLHHRHRHQSVNLSSHFGRPGSPSGVSGQLSTSSKIPSKSESSTGSGGSGRSTMVEFIEVVKNPHVAIICPLIVYLTSVELH